MSTISPTLATATTVPAHQPTLRPRGSSESIQASERAYARNETENLNGLVQIGTPTRMRSSTKMPTAETRARTPMETANQSRGRWSRVSGFGDDACCDGAFCEAVFSEGLCDEDIRIPRGKIWIVELAAI